jgi:hypothetical protein
VYTGHAERHVKKTDAAEVAVTASGD